MTVRELRRALLNLDQDATVFGQDQAGLFSVGGGIEASAIMLGVPGAGEHDGVVILMATPMGEVGGF